MKDPLNKLWWFFAGQPYEHDDCKKTVYKSWKYCPRCGKEIEW